MAVRDAFTSYGYQIGADEFGAPIVQTNFPTADTGDGDFLGPQSDSCSCPGAAPTDSTSGDGLRTEMGGARMSDPMSGGALRY